MEPDTSFAGMANICFEGYIARLVSSGGRSLFCGPYFVRLHNEKQCLDTGSLCYVWMNFPDMKDGVDCQAVSSSPTPTKGVYRQERVTEQLQHSHATCLACSVLLNTTVISPRKTTIEFTEACFSQCNTAGLCWLQRGCCMYLSWNQ